MSDQASAPQPSTPDTKRRALASMRRVAGQMAVLQIRFESRLSGMDAAAAAETAGEIEDLRPRYDAIYQRWLAEDRPVIEGLPVVAREDQVRDYDSMSA